MSATTGLEFAVVLVRYRDRDISATEFTVTGGSALVGRDPQCEVRLRDDASISRRHARIEWTGQGRFRIVDLGSANGVWVEGRQVFDEHLQVGEQFRVGDSFLECRPRPTAPRRDVTQTEKVNVAELMADARTPLDEAGEPVVMSDRQATLLDDPACVYYVTAGKVEVFFVTVEDGVDLGGRHHFVTVEAGGAFFGMEPSRSHGSLFIAFRSTGAGVRRIAADALEALARDSRRAAQVSALVDGWVMSTTTRLMRDLVSRVDVDIELTVGVRASLDYGQRARSAKGVLWIPLEHEPLIFNGMRTLSPTHPTSFFPLTPQTWIEPEDQLDRPLVLEPCDTQRLFTNGHLWVGLRHFHEQLCACVAISKRVSLVDEQQRLIHKAREADAARASAFDALGAVLASRNRDDMPTGAAAGRFEPILEACRMVGNSLGLDVRAPVNSSEEHTFQDHVAAIAATSGFRTRLVALRGNWWQTDAGPLVTHREHGVPVALLPEGPGVYTSVDVARRTRQPVTPEYAGTLAPFAVTFYRPLPAGTLRSRDLLRFGARGLAPDLWMLLGIGLLAGALGAITPLLTGQMIDRAIPQGERGLLVQIGLCMLIVTLASAVLSIVKSVAVVRVETRMDQALQSALWDRLLNLPAGFFRQFGAGDLAERASGIHAIREVLSNSGIRSILGVINALAYLVLMLYLSPALAVIAVAITFVLVIFTTIGNYLLLRLQRPEVELRGLIASLVLQLIAGVAKVRMSGAENHAFRAWAQRFSKQKRLGFALGRLRSVLGTLGAGFQVLVPLGIFAAIYRLQSGDGAAGLPSLTTGKFVAFYAAFGIFVTAMQDLCNASLSLLVIVPFYERMEPILSTAPETDPTKARPGRLSGRVAVSRLHFRYRPDSPWVLKDVSFSIRPGEFVAVVGPSGCGKSTLLRLLLGFERPTSGVVQYDGQDLAQLDTRAVRQQLGVVLQESRLVPTDIFRNIVGDNSRSVDEAWEAAELAGIADDIRQMPMGLHTTVAEGGGTFSGGQIQRLLIARALIGKPRIIFFDEATSALDNKAQAVVINSLDRLDATRVMIAHRLSTLLSADRIIYLDGGQIQEEGTYTALMARGGLFAQLARRQMA